MFVAFMTFLKGLPLKIAAFILAACLFIGIGFYVGSNYEIGKTKKIDNKEVAQVIQKNESLQTTADKVGQAQVIYKDRVVTQYKVISKDVIKYVDKENSDPSGTVWLPAEWVCLHDRAVAAANGDSETTASSSGNATACTKAQDTTGKTPTVAVKSGDVLEVMSENYQSYAAAKAKAEYMTQLYNEIADQVNSKK